jgi:zinc transport system permease protein
MLELLSYPFMQYALLAALATGLAAPSVGTYLVQRRLALLGDGIGHIAVTGVALGLLTNTFPTVTAIVVAGLGALAIEWIRSSGHASGDVALALLFYGGIAGGVFLIGIGGQSAARLQGFLFGSLVTVSPVDLAVTLILTGLTLVVTVGLQPWLYASALDPDFAKVSGVHVGWYNSLLAIVAALTVTVSMNTVGLLLVSALMVVPVAAAQQLSRSFRGTFFGSMAIGCFTAVGGLLLASWISVNTNLKPPTGPTIVLLALVVFLATWPFGAAIRRRLRRAAPFPVSYQVPHLAVATHPHVHHEECGHPAITHGDHVDYLHDGHRHAPHGAHYDEH